MAEETTQEQENTQNVITDANLPKEIPEFSVGDTVRIMYRISEGGKTRAQPFEGIVISKKGPGISKTFTVRRVGSDGIGVERIFPLYSPNIEAVEVLKSGAVRRSKLYYLRGKKGRAATRVKEKIIKVVQKEEAPEQTDAPSENKSD